MSDSFQPNLDFKAANEAAEDGEALIIDLDGYEGPLHVLLALARSQKVDLMQISITRLCSSGVSVGLSPVVPTGTSPVDPWSICHSTRDFSVSRSSAPSLNGVTRAGMDPLIIACVSPSWGADSPPLQMASS